MQEQNIAQMLENPFMQYNHIEIVSVTSDSAVMSLDIRRDTTNIYGYVHGGAFFTMADCCAGLTARSDGRQYVTQNASVNFIHNVKAGHLTARGRTVSRRRHICVVAVEITDETDTLLFSSTFSMYCISAEDCSFFPALRTFCVPVRGFFIVQRILSAARSSPWEHTRSAAVGFPAWQSDRPAAPAPAGCTPAPSPPWADRPRSGSGSKTHRIPPGRCLQRSAGAAFRRYIRPHKKPAGHRAGTVSRMM